MKRSYTVIAMAMQLPGTTTDGKTDVDVLYDNEHQIRALTDKEAKLKAMQYCLKTFPKSQGFFNHEAGVIPNK